MVVAEKRSNLMKGKERIMKVLIVYYSLYGHIYRMAEAVKEGAGSVSGADVRICRVPETLPEEVLQKMGALETQKSLKELIM